MNVWSVSDGRRNKRIRESVLEIDKSFMTDPMHHNYDDFHNKEIFPDEYYSVKIIVGNRVRHSD